jgi:hypothetical protein
MAGSTGKENAAGGANGIGGTGAFGAIGIVTPRDGACARSCSSGAVSFVTSVASSFATRELSKSGFSFEKPPIQC